MNPYDRIRRPDFQAPQEVTMPWLQPPEMMEQPQDESIGQNTGIMAKALRQRLMGNRRGPADSAQDTLSKSMMGGLKSGGEGMRSL